MKRREQVMVGACVVVIGGSLWFALSPSGTSSKTNLITLDQARAKTTESLSNVRRLRTEQTALEPTVKSRAYSDPANQLVPLVIGSLQSAAERAGIHLREVRPLRPKLVTDEGDPVTAARTTTGASSRSVNAAHEVLGARVPVEVRFRAQFQPNVVRFLYDLENPSGRMVIDKISITSADARFRTVEVSAQISVFTRSSTGMAGGDTGGTINDTATKG